MSAGPTAEGSQPLTIYTIGHSNQPLASFIALLQRHGIQSLVDVRSAPYSRYVPHFNRVALEDAVERCGIRYIYLGEELGGRPQGDEFYDSQGYVLYYRVAKAPFFLRGVKRLIDEGWEHPTAIMCSEEDPSNCHRRRLIGRVLKKQGVRVLHIRGDGHAQTQEELEPPKPPTLWGKEEKEEEESEWKSTQRVSRRSQPRSSSSHSDEWESDGF